MVNSVEESSLVGEWNKKLQLKGDPDRTWGNMWLRSNAKSGPEEQVNSEKKVVDLI